MKKIPLRVKEYIELRDVLSLTPNDRREICAYFEASNGSFHHIELLEEWDPDEYGMSTYPTELAAMEKLFNILKEAFPDREEIAVYIWW